MAQYVYHATRPDGRPVCIDQVIDRGNGEYVGAYGGQTLAEVQAEYPGAAMVTLAEYVNIEDAYWRNPVREITEAEYRDALEVLPPVAWKCDGSGESFKCSERTCGNITNIYARRGNRYFTLSDDIHTPHAEIMQRIPA